MVGDANEDLYSRPFKASKWYEKSNENHPFLNWILKLI